MEAKQPALETLDRFPEDCIAADDLYHVYVKRCVSRGLAEADAGDLISHEEVACDLRLRWAGA